jgi:predicted RNA-binding Zn ribbon-like protein
VLDERGAIGVDVRGTGVDGAFGRIVAIVFKAMLDGSWARLKACRQCGWAFYDTSKNRSGSWCSMQICGNRTKTRAYRRRKAAGDPT